MHPIVKVSEEVNREYPPRKTRIQLLIPYTHLELPVEMVNSCREQLTYLQFQPQVFVYDTCDIVFVCDFQRLLFTARCYAERGYEIVCRLSVRLSVRMSVCNV